MERCDGAGLLDQRFLKSVPWASRVVNWDAVKGFARLTSAMRKDCELVRRWGMGQREGECDKMHANLDTCAFLTNCMSIMRYGTTAAGFAFRPSHGKPMQHNKMQYEEPNSWYNGQVEVGSWYMCILVH